MSPETPNPQKPLNIFPVLLISAAIVILWLIPVYAYKSRAGSTGTGAGGFISIIALLVTIIAPLVYGRYFRDENGAMFIGGLPFLLTYGFSQILSSTSPAATGYFAYSVFYIVSLCMIGALEGFFAAKKTAISLLVALILAGTWAGIFFSGIR
jgi:hypothetical protein